MSLKVNRVDAAGGGHHSCFQLIQVVHYNGMGVGGCRGEFQTSKFQRYNGINIPLIFSESISVREIISNFGDNIFTVAFFCIQLSRYGKFAQW